MNYRTFFIIAALSPLAIGNSSYASKKCQETELTGMQYIAQEEVPNFWVPVKKSTPIRFGRKIERAISNGRIGFVITNQTIDEEGNVSNVKLRLSNKTPSRGLFIKEGFAVHFRYAYLAVNDLRLKSC